jgi:hypothetical protein
MPQKSSSKNPKSTVGSTLDQPDAPHFLHPRGFQRVECKKTAKKSRYNRLTDELGLGNSDANTRITTFLT